MSKQLVLITGATGHLGFRTLVFALEDGYRARVAVRSLEKADKIKKAASIQPYSDMIEYVVVPDITADGAYNEAIRGVELVLHIASPLSSSTGESKDWKELLYDPAEKGTLSMLAAAASEQSVKRVIITSSIVTVEPKNGSDRAGPYDLKVLPDADTLANLSQPFMAYTMSKVLAHVAGDKFMQDKKPHFDLIRILPGYIQGANEMYCSAEDMKRSETLGSNEGTMNTALGIASGQARITHQVFLDDVARAHVLALKPDIAKGGENLLIFGNGGESIPWSDFVPVIKRQFPEAVASGLIDPKADDESYLGKYDVSGSEKALDFKFAGVEEMAKSVVGQYVRLAGSV